MSLFVTFEGPEGSGKSTQVAAVASELTARGVIVRTTREPGGTALGERIRDILLAVDDDAMTPRAEALLLLAARAQHVSEVVAPALERGSVVLCDRFFDSTLAYQGAGRGLDFDDLAQLQRFAAGELLPDVTILLDLPVQVGFARRRASGEPLSRFDRDRREFHERVRDWFLQTSTSDPDRWIVFDANLPAEDLTAQITNSIVARLPARSTATPNRTRR